MANPVTIKKGSSPSITMDYEALYKEGIEHIKQHSGDLWTDYNLHDPGITMLEYLCFGLTDIGYRCNFPIQDLLYSRINKQINTVDNAFYFPEEILPCAPLVNDDYRKLLIDGLREVDNAWIEPVTDPKELFKGLYDIRLKINKEQHKGRTPKMIKEEALALLSGNRNLCEDIREIYILEQQVLEIEAGINLENDASAEQVLADIIHELGQFISPRVTFYNPDEMLSQGSEINDLFDGPRLKHGYIKAAELQSLVTVINMSQLCDTIVGISGVRSLIHISVKINGLLQFNEEIEIPDNTYFVLSDALILPKSTPIYPLSFRRNNQVVQPNYIQASRILRTRIAKDSQQYLHNQLLKRPFNGVDKDLADIGAYYSIQRFFPVVYGIGTYGITGEANLLRKAQSRQLKGYLAIFETMFSSFLHQLTQIRNLFSIEDKHNGLSAPEKQANDSGNWLDLGGADPGPSYFTRFPFDIPDIDSLILFNGKNSREEVEESLMQNTAIDDQELDRRNMFLDHLLARFSEKINGEWLNMFVYTTEDVAQIKKSLIKTKCNVLRQYETLSRDRGKGFDYNVAFESVPDLDAFWINFNVSGLKKRLSYLINLPSYADRIIAIDPPMGQFTIEKGNVSSDNSGGNRKGFALKSMLRNGRSVENYEISKTDDENIYKVWYKEELNGRRHLYKLFQTESVEEAQLKRDRFIKSIQDFDRDSHGFFIVEHLLLRPMHRGGKKIVLDVGLISKPPAHEYPDSISQTKGDGQNATANDSQDWRKDTFETLVYASLEEQKGIAEDLLLIGSNLENYKVLKEGDKFFIVITQNKQPLLVSSQSYDTQTAAYHVCNEVHNRIGKVLVSAIPTTDLTKGRPEEESDRRGNAPESMLNKFNEWIEYKDEWVNGMNLKNASTFYGHHLSIVLPDWPNLFVESTFKIWFKQLVSENIPAHIQADLLWLNWREMKDFEKTYIPWMNAKLNPGTDLKALDELSFLLAEKLGATVDKDETPQTSNSLNENRLNAMIDAFGLSFLFKPTELQIIQGINEVLEYWLQKEKIGTWALLNVTEPPKLREVMKMAGLNDDLVLVNSWKKQAGYAAKGDWETLEIEQKRLVKEMNLIDSPQTSLQKMTDIKRKNLLGIQF